METIKVNMSPNPLDVQTIHASQNDGEARQWEFELHNNGELIDTSEITEQMFFKAYKGGTEQLLPENTSTPTTSPFLGDTKYPQGLLTDQEFTYRQSPTEEDGLAFVESIKGNTLNWNQLVENGDFSTSSGWTGQFATVTISNNVASVRQDRAGDYVALRKSTLQGLTGHKYLAVADVKSAKKTAIAFYLSNAYSSAYDIQANTRTVVRAIITVSNANTGGFNVYTNRNVELAEGDVVEFYHVMLFDLTQMGLDITEPSDFTSLFPLSYYAYNQGSLLSFNSNGIKTVGKNQFGEIQVGMRLNANTGVIEPSSNTNWVSKKIFTNGKINVLALSSNGYTGSINIAEYDANDNYIQNTNFFYGTNISGNYRASKTLNANTAYVIPNGYQTGGASAITGAEIELSTYDIETFEPYTSSTLSLPISTYFPNGMKSAGNVYDELTESKAITRIGSVTFNGSERDWGTASGWKVGCFVLNNAFVNAKSVLGYGTIANLKNSYGLDINTPANLASASNTLLGIGQGGDNGKAFYISLGSTYDTAEKLKNYLASNPLTVYYELATPLENYGVVDLGSLAWTKASTESGTSKYRFQASLSGFKPPINSTSLPNIICSKYAIITNDDTWTNSKTGISLHPNNGNVLVCDTSYSTAESFKTAMNGVYLLYEKQNPQGFTTASLVTENAEIPLSNEDGILIGKCTEQLSENPGFIDAKIKLSDSDGTCYSNKLQLHVERSPQ